jgi:hypothetical protein
VDGDTGEKHGDALLGAEKRIFARVVGDCDGDAVKEPGGAGQDIEMSVGDGIKGARIDAMAHGKAWNESFR